MEYSICKKSIIISLVIFFILTQWPVAAAQDDPESVLLDEISQDWATDMILILIETPNKWDPTYSNDYNITNLNVLNEISAVEETLDPQKEDFGEQDDVFFVHSISVLIKEIYVSPRNVAIAVSEELDIPVPVEQIPGEYAIPQDQDEIDHIVSQIPQEVLEMLVRDTNNDGVWDTAVMWLAVPNRSSGLESDINTMIDKYYLDMNAEGDDYNSQDSWWERIESEEIHCRMTNMGYVTSHESYYGTAQTMDLWLPILIIVIIGILSLFLFMAAKPPKDKLRDEGQADNTLKTALVLMIILIAVCFSFVIIDTTPSPSPVLRRFSEEMWGGQMGYVLVRGNPAPTNREEPTNGGGSMKDIEVLDEMDEMQEQLRDIEGISPYCIIDIMKTMQISEGAIPDMVAQMPGAIQNQLNQTQNLSFWDAIHIANDDENSPWGRFYGKSQQDSMINIFYNSITVEMQSTFVNWDFSKSLMYIQMPMEDSEDSLSLLRAINDVIDERPVGRSTSGVVIIGEYSLAYGFLAWMVEVMILFVIMALGAIVFAVYLHQLRKKRKEDDGDVEPFIPDYGIGFKEDYLYGVQHLEGSYKDDSYKRKPPF